MKHIVFALSFLMAILVFAAPRPKPGAPDFFPIMGWDVGGVFQGEFTLELFQEMAAAGFNIAGIFAEKDAMQLISQVDGLYFWAYPGKLIQTWEAHVEDEASYAAAFAKDLEEFRENPAVYGYFITDEPTAEHFPFLAKAVHEVKTQAPGVPWYLNLLPVTVEPRYLKAASYADYIDRYIDACQPDWVGYDNYTLMEDGTLRADHWKQLQEFREATLRHGLPFQACVLLTAHMNYRVPSQDDIFFEVYGALLYGAKGIQYFTYWPPARSNYRETAVDQLGNKTQTWYHVRAVNQSVHALAGILNRLESTNVYHFQPCEPMEGEVPPSEDSLVVGPASPEQSLAIGEFRDTTNGDCYMMILNKDLHRSTNLRDLQWRRKPMAIQVCSPFKAGTFLPEGFYSENSFVAPGHALLLRLTFEE